MWSTSRHAERIRADAACRLASVVDWRNGSMVVWEDMALVGRIARPHGLQGHVVVNPETDFVETRFAVGATLWTRSADGDRQLTISETRVQNGRPVVRFEGCTRVDDAERLAGLELRIRDTDLLPLADGSYYAHQLTGCQVEDSAGTRIGTVLRVEGGLGGSRLVVDGPRGEILIPFAQEICVTVDVAAKRIRVVPVEGLLALNERSTK